MTLYICEKPSQGRDIAAVLGATQRQDGHLQGNGVIVTWCLGHLLSLAPPEHYCENVKPWRRSVLPVIPTTWKMQPNPKTTKQLTVVKKLIKAATHVVVATDADREGEAIAREVLDFCGYKGTIERLWLSALDPASIKKALATVRTGKSTEPLYQAALGRSRADWLIGMNMTMAVTSSFSKGTGVLSVGRVQTPTLQLVVDRDLAIEKFTVSDYYVVVATFRNHDNDAFTTTWTVPEDAQNDAGHCAKRSVADIVCRDIAGKEGRITAFSQSEKSTNAPLCLSLSSLQKIASSRLGLGAKETLDIAQRLYEKYKAATYPRTDCGYLPMSQRSDAPGILATLTKTYPKLSPLIAECNADYQSPVWNDNKITAHHGIIPTNNAYVNIDNMTDNEKRVFNIICRYYLAQFLGSYVYAQRKVTVNCANHSFGATDNTPLKQGWKTALAVVEKTDSDNEKSNNIPLLTKNEEVVCAESDIKSKRTKPPARFTEGTLIAAMKNIAKLVEDKALKKILKETAGIGTEATRANMIELLLRREFIRKEKKYLISTDKGRALLDKLPNVVKHPATTAEWEQILDEVATGHAPLSTFLEGQTKTLNTMLQRLDKIIETQPRGDCDAEYQCPECKSELLRRNGKKGFFWGCTAYPNCNTTLQDVEGKPVQRKPQILSHHDCPTCKSHKLVKRQGKKAEYWACSGYPDCKAIFWDRVNMPDFDNVPKPKKGKGKK